MKRLDIMGRLTDCIVKDELKVGKGRCIHCPGKSFILKDGQSEHDFILENQDYINNLEREQAKNNNKIKEEVPTEIYNTVINADQNTSLIVAGTGIGKSAIIHSLMFDAMRNDNNELIKEGIIVVPNTNLIEQFNKYGMHEGNGYHIITYQKLLEWKSSGPDYDLGFDPSKCGVISFDECHRALANEWKDSCDLIISSLPEGSKVYGFTATPERTDNKNAISMFGKPVYEISLEEALERNCYTNPPDYIVSETDYTALKKVKALKDILNNSKMPESSRKIAESCLYGLDISNEKFEEEQKKIVSEQIDKVMNNGTGAKIVVFCENTKEIKESKNLYNTMLKEKYGAKNITTLEYTCESGKFNSKEQQIWDGFQNENRTPEHGKIEIVYSISKFDEGFHINNLDIAIRRKPTDSEIVSKQEDGRMFGKRDKPGVIIDFSGSIHKEGSLDWYRIANHVKNSNFYEHRDILHDNSAEYYKVLKNIERNILDNSNRNIVEYNGKYYTPMEFVDEMKFTDNDKCQRKLRKTYVLECMKKGMSAKEILARRPDIEKYYGGPIEGVTF